MITILCVFLVLLGSVYLGVQLSHDPGYVLITINHWSIESTLAILVLALILAFILFHGLLILLGKISRGPSVFREWRIKRRALRAQKKTRQGLIEFSEGYWSEARNHLIKALPDTDTPLLNYLTAARAAQEMGDNKLRDDYLRQAQQSMPEARIAVELTQAQLQLANKQWEQALATLRHLQDLAPHHPYVLKLLTRLYKEVKDWPQLILLLPDLKRYRVFKETDYDKLRQETWLYALTDRIKHQQTEGLDELIATIPHDLMNNPEIVEVYVRYLLSQNQLEKAESILRRCLRKTFNDQLVELYGQINYDKRQLAFVESLQKKQGCSASLYLSLGQLCIHHDLWGKARSYLEKSIDLKPTPDAYEALGKLLEKLNEPDLASANYHKGLLLAISLET